MKIHSDVCEHGKQIAWRNSAGTLSALYCRLRFIVEDTARSSSNKKLYCTGRTAHWIYSKYHTIIYARVFLLSYTMNQYLNAATLVYDEVN